MQGLIRYLFGPGRYQEHRNPHIVAGFWDPAELEPPLRGDGTRDFRYLDSLLTQPLALLGERNYRKPVWHLPLRTAPEDPVLTDEQWAQVAEEIMARTGLAPPGDDGGVRWIAVRHAQDHIHIVATLARTDGDLPDVWRDAYPIREACRAMEDRLGLRRTAPADRTAARRPHRGESEKARRQGRAQESRIVLRRQVLTAAGGARNEAEFFERLATDHVLVRKRIGEAGEVTGYAVAVPGDLNKAGEPVWFGGYQLAADLTLPKLRRRWTPAPGSGPGSADYSPVSGRHLSASTARAVLRRTIRQVADRSRSAEEFFDHLDRAGLLVRRRFSEHTPDQVTGYAVTLPGHTGADGQPRWYKGGSLAEELSWPHLHHRWNTATGEGRRYEPTQPDFTHEERQAFYNDAAGAAAYATAQLRRYLAFNPHAAQDACWAASDTLHVAARALRNPHLRKAADAYDRAARAPYGRIPKPTPAGNGLRTAARLMAMAGLIGDQNTVAILMLVTNLITLIDTIAQLRQTQQRAAQATAARTAADHLRNARPQREQAPHRLPETRREPTPYELAMANFPTPWAPTMPSGPGAVPGDSPYRPRPGAGPSRTRPAR
ncbi:relaxase/mobilization nuclease domain-containing protein [Actinomadura scrupuli]|uniref:relaxase/mobilization nuclease domain-containing protein n=1 Tax=Actinomadura scrupuli TaxID=559629 RepID=UPI003D98927E